MIDYLYYKLYKYYGKANAPQIYAAVFSGGLIGINLLTVNSLLAKLNIIPFLFSHHSAGIFGVVCGILAFLYYKKNRREAIIGKYSQESKKGSIIGGIAVIAYMIFTFVLFIAIAWYKPGYLPQ